MVKRKKGKAYALGPISDKDKFFLDPSVLEVINEGISQYNSGKTIKVDKSEFVNLLGF
ncbi:hypothetical protein [Aquiflexum sp. TKW24L]|uniref:hypothetical protein n=1 Tax=Aquiflexum sp. TKW24L TaxID=2942212 RepID=UPI0020C0667F|nr:hypothetical protein [Aquiflexum sp. TKW24L]